MVCFSQILIFYGVQKKFGNSLKASVMICGPFSLKKQIGKKSDMVHV